MTPGRRVRSCVLFDSISFRSALSDPANGGQRLTRLLSITHTDIGLDNFNKGMAAFWRRLVDAADALPPGFLEHFSQSLLAVSSSRVRGKLPICMRRHKVEAAQHRRGNATVAIAPGRSRARNGAVWVSGTGGSRAHIALFYTRAARDGQSACSRSLLQPVQHGQREVCACGAGHLRARAHVVCGQVLRRQTRGCALSDGLERAPDDRLLQDGYSKGTLWDRRCSAYKSLRPGLN